MITVFPLINYVLTDVEKVSLRLVFVVCFFFLQKHTTTWHGGV